MKMFRSIVAMLLTFSLVISFSACSDKGNDESVAKEKQEETTTYDESGLVPSEKPDNEVEKMGLTVNSGSGVEVSANTKYFTTNLDFGDFAGESDSEFRTYAGNQNNLPELLLPVSSDMYVSKSLPTFFAALIDDAGYINATQVNSDVESGYVAFDVFVKVDQAQKIYWAETTVTCDDNPDVLTAMRVALVNCGTVAQNSEADAILSAKPDNALQNRVVMYEPDSINHTDASGYADGATVPDLYLTAAFSKHKPTGNGNNIMQEAQYAGPAFGTRATDANKAANAYFNAEAGINRIRVYLWVEGNDVDCMNDVASATVGLNLVFSL